MANEALVPSLEQLVHVWLSADKTLLPVLINTPFASMAESFVEHWRKIPAIDQVLREELVRRQLINYELWPLPRTLIDDVIDELVGQRTTE
jgi:hypothetical protein